MSSAAQMPESGRIHSFGQDQRRYAVLILDMLNDFVYGKLKCERAARIIPNIKTLRGVARKNNVPVFYCNDEHLPIDSYEMKLWGKHAMKGTKGAMVIDSLKPHKSDYVIPKRTYSAFDGTGLDKALQGVYDGKGANTVIITGLHTNICDRHTAYDAFVRNLDIVVPEDAVEAFTEGDHVSGLDYLKRVYGAKIRTVSEIVKELGGQ
ncbi:MAG: cysteine hydrolase [Nitrososphaera sp.]